MAVIASCSGNAGAVVKGAIQTEAPAMLAIKLGTDIRQLGAAVSVKVRQNILAQFQNTLSDAIYTVPFGDGPGDVQITFVASRSCSGDKTPLAQLENWYRSKRLRPSYTTAQLVTVGSTTFTGFLIGFVIDGQSSTQPLVQGTLVYKAWQP